MKKRSSEQVHSPLAEALRKTTQQFEEKVGELSLLRRVGDIVRYIFDLKGFSEKFLEIILEETSAENCSFMIKDSEGDRLVVKAARGRNRDLTFYADIADSDITFPVGQGVCGKAADLQKTILVNDVEKSDLFLEQDTRVPIGSILCTPLVDKGRLLGVINISHSRTEAFTEGNRRTMELLGDFLSCLVSNAIDYVRMRDQEKFRAMSEGVHLTILLIDGSTGMIADCNSYIEYWLGFSRKEVAGKKLFADLVCPDEHMQATDLLALIEMEEQEDSCEFSFMRKDGSLRTGEVSGTIIRYQERDVIHLSISDITENKRAREELQKTNDYLDNIIESSLECIIISDSEGHVTRVNKAFLKLLDCTEEEVLGNTPAAFAFMDEGTYESTSGEMVQITKEYIEAAFDITAKLFEEGKITSWETYVIRKDRKLVPVEQNLVLLHSPQGAVIGALSVIRDITLRRKAGKELKETKDFLENIINNSVDGILVSDLDGYITLANTSVANMLGYAREELIGQHTNVLAAEGVQDRRFSKEEILANPEKIDSILLGERIWCKKDGSCIPVEINMSLLYDEHDRPFRAVASIRNISERKQAEEALKRSEELYRSLIENANDAIISINRKGVVIDWNKKAQEIFGYTAEEILEESVLKLVRPSEKESQSSALDFLSQKEDIATYDATKEAVVVRKDGREFPAEISYYTSKVHGEYFVTALVRDISERKEMERKLLQSEKLRSLGELAAGVAHDFNNILAAILGRTQLLSRCTETPLDQEERRKSITTLKEGLLIIEKAALDGAETVRRIQEFSRRKDQDDDSAYFSPVNINQVLDDAVEFTKTKWKDDSESKRIEVSITRDYAEVPFMEGNLSELRELFTNLINNAVDAMSRGGEICLKTFVEGKDVVVTVKDNGTGVPEDLRDRIFDPFFTTKGVKSTGLGLSVSYGIISRHRGNIKINSIVDQGTTFTIHFPSTEQKASAVLQEDQAPLHQHKARILVVDDEKEVCAMLKDILTFEGHTVDTAPDGFKALETFSPGTYDMVFTDLGMPGMTGWELAREIKSRDDSVPIVLVTGWSVDSDATEIRENGVHSILNKPFKMNDVIQKVYECTQQE